MSQRIKNHVIEDESRLFFKRMLPPVWVCRDKSNDYGIDCEVEIFDDNGNSTGLVFWVQLKGTDSKAEKTIKNISFKKEKISQFLSYDIPVLLVRYSSYKQTQYVKWAKPFNSTSASKSLNIQFFESETWTKNTYHEIQKYLEKQSFIKRGLVKTPVKTFVGRIENNNGNEIPYLNISIIKQCLNTKKQYFELTNNSADSILHIKVGKDYIETNFSDLALATMSLNFEDVDTTQFELLTKYILITFCQALYDIGKNDIAEQIIFDNDLIDIIQNYKEYLISLLPYLLSGHNPSKVLDKLNYFFKNSPNDNLIAIITQIILTTNRKENNEELSKTSEQFLKIQLDIAKERNNGLATATSYYNLGNFYRSTNNLELSLKCYLDARIYDASYKTQHYYYYELAGVLFLMGKYHFATLFYTKSIQLNTDNPYAKALLAHSLIYLGNYQLAIEKLDEFLIESQKKADTLDLEEWQLWYYCLATLLKNDFPKHQIRNTELAQKLTEQNEFEKALDFDLLYDIAWFNIGVKSAYENDHLYTFIAFCIVGLINNCDIEAWINATISALNNNIEIIFLIYTIKTAYHHNGYNYINSLREVLKQQNIENLDAIIELIDKTIESRKEQPITVRFFNDANNYETIKISPN